MGAFNSLYTVLGIFIPRKPQNKGSQSTFCWTACAKHKVLWPWTKCVLVPENLTQSQRVCRSGLLPKIFPQGFGTIWHSKAFFSPPQVPLGYRHSFGPCCLGTVFSRILANDQQVRVRRMYFHWMFQDSSQEPGPCSPDLGLYYWVSLLLSNNKYLTCLPVHRLENVQLHRGSQHTYTDMKNSTVWWIFPRLWNTRDATRRGSLWFCHLLIARQKNTSLFIHVPFETAKSSCCLTTLRITYAKRCQKRLTFGFAPYKMLSLPALSW